MHSSGSVARISWMASACARALRGGPNRGVGIVSKYRARFEGPTHLNLRRELCHKVEAVLALLDAILHAESAPLRPVFHLVPVCQYDVIKRVIFYIVDSDGYMRGYCTVGSSESSRWRNVVPERGRPSTKTGACTGDAFSSASEPPAFVTASMTLRRNIRFLTRISHMKYSPSGDSRILFRSLIAQLGGADPAGEPERTRGCTWHMAQGS